jgi:hypothetical protein
VNVRPTAHYPPADMSPAEFERFVVALLESASPLVEGLRVTLHDRIEGVDGRYDFDASVRFRLGGMDFLVLIEAKRHTDPIERQYVMVLHEKLRSVGAHKAAIIATAPYQSGALEYAKVHGIALATVTEGRFTFETRSRDQPSPLSRERAEALYQIPEFVGHAYAPGDGPGSTRVTLLSPECPEYVAEALLGVASEATPT